MSRRVTTLGLLSLAAVLSLVAVLVHAHSSFSTEQTERVQTEGIKVPDVRNGRNLAQQPEAIKLLRRIGGRRFRLKTPPVVTLQGVLTTRSDRQEIQVSRYQNASGEQVNLVLIP